MAPYFKHHVSFEATLQEACGSFTEGPYVVSFSSRRDAPRAPPLPLLFFSPLLDGAHPAGRVLSPGSTLTIAWLEPILSLSFVDGLHDATGEERLVTLPFRVDPADAAGIACLLAAFNEYWKIPPPQAPGGDAGSVSTDEEKQAAAAAAAATARGRDGSAQPYLAPQKRAGVAPRIGPYSWTDARVSETLAAADSLYRILQVASTSTSVRGALSRGAWLTFQLREVITGLAAEMAVKSGRDIPALDGWVLHPDGTATCPSASEGGAGGGGGEGDGDGDGGGALEGAAAPTGGASLRPPAGVVLANPSHHVGLAGAPAPAGGDGAASSAQTTSAAGPFVAAGSPAAVAATPPAAVEQVLDAADAGEAAACPPDAASEAVGGGDVDDASDYAAAQPPADAAVFASGPDSYAPSESSDGRYAHAAHPQQHAHAHRPSLQRRPHPRPPSPHHPRHQAPVYPQPLRTQGQRPHASHLQPPPPPPPPLSPYRSQPLLQQLPQPQHSPQSPQPQQWGWVQQQQLQHQQQHQVYHHHVGEDGYDGSAGGVQQLSQHWHLRGGGGLGSQPPLPPQPNGLLRGGAPGGHGAGYTAVVERVTVDETGGTTTHHVTTYYPATAAAMAFGPAALAAVAAGAGAAAPLQAPLPVHAVHYGGQPPPPPPPPPPSHPLPQQHHHIHHQLFAEHQPGPRRF